MKRLYNETKPTMTAVKRGSNMMKNDIDSKLTSIFDVQKYGGMIYNAVGEIGNFVHDEKERKNIIEKNKIKLKEKFFGMRVHLRPYLNVLQIITGLELFYYIGHAKTLRNIILSLSGLTAHAQ